MIRKIFKNFSLFIHGITNWILVRLTPGGKLVLAGIVISAVVGIDTNKTMAYQIFTFLLILLLISMAWRFFFKPRLSAKRILPKFCSAGQPLIYRVTIENHSKKIQKNLRLFDSYVEVQTFTDSALKGKTEKLLAASKPKRKKKEKSAFLLGQKVRFTQTSLPSIEPNNLFEVQLEITPRRRGRIYFTSFKLACPDPLGLFRAVVSIQLPQSILVLPKRYRIPDIRLSGSRKYQSGGVALASSIGDSEEFVSLRDYRYGDPLRRIHWKSWAKAGKPIVKEYQDEFFVRHALVLDTFIPTAGSPLFEEAVSIAASFAYSMQTQESLLDLIFVGLEAYCFTSGRGQIHINRIIEILASVRVCTDKPFSQLPPKVLERSAALSSCICILLSWDENRKNFINQLRALGVPVLILLIKEKAGGPHFTDANLRPPENFHVLNADNIQQGLHAL